MYIAGARSNEHFFVYGLTYIICTKLQAIVLSWERIFQVLAYQTETRINHRNVDIMHKNYICTFALWLTGTLLKKRSDKVMIYGHKKWSHNET
jgi:hypothetical protein